MHTVQLVPVEMLRSGVALAAPVMRTLKLLIQAFATASALLGGTRASDILLVTAAVVAISGLPRSSSPSGRLVLAGRGRDTGLDFHGRNALSEVDRL
jgi:hypothetical protein